MKLPFRGYFAGIAVFATTLALSGPVVASNISDVVKWSTQQPGGSYSLFESITLYEDGSALIYQPGFGSFTEPGNGTESVIVGSCGGCNDVSIGLIEPGGAVGDLFTSLTNSQGYQVFTFTSVEDGDSFSIPSDPYLPANESYNVVLLDENGPIDVAPYVFGGDGEGNIMTIQSDVPEPVTLSLFGAGLAGAAAVRRRKKAKA